MSEVGHLCDIGEKEKGKSEESNSSKNGAEYGKDANT